MTDVGITAEWVQWARTGSDTVTTVLEYPQFLTPKMVGALDSIGRDAFSEVK